ncbi:MAG: class I SAM-dependent methyltransferase [Alphaproteobacteria bacterium]|nr:class I SAM-dependent methyltransferase [Alphaproteobacteria bacterium]
MPAQISHAMLPLATHDEGARQKFVTAMREQLTLKMLPDTRALYEGIVKPKFAREHGRAPQDRAEVRRAMGREPPHQLWSSALRTTQEMLWDSVGETVARELPSLVERAKATLPRSGGSLRLDPTLEIPRYLLAQDNHVMPGNYFTDIRDDGDVYAGAMYDRGVFIFLKGDKGGLSDGFGVLVCRFITERFPEFSPKRILDLGCTVGNSTLPYVDQFPGAEVHAIDVGAPCLRYAHARAEALGKRVHFSQQNAESTDFPDGFFDLIVSHLVLHETSNKAVPRIMRECHRLLGHGGLTLHAETPPYAGVDPFDQYLCDWDTHYNLEPFIGRLHELDQRRMMIDAGFKAADCVAETIPTYRPTADVASETVRRSLDKYGSKRTIWGAFKR